MVKTHSDLPGFKVCQNIISKLSQVEENHSLKRKQGQGVLVTVRVSIGWVGLGRVFYTP